MKKQVLEKWSVTKREDTQRNNGVVVCQGKRLGCTGVKGWEGDFKQNMAFFLHLLQVKQIIWQLNNVRVSTNYT